MVVLDKQDYINKKGPTGTEGHIQNTSYRPYQQAEK